MLTGDTQHQLVTFQLGAELYGVDIMDVKEIVQVQEIRPIPNAPFYVEGIFNLRGEIIPIINLHKRFHLSKIKREEGEEDMENLEGGFIILSIEGNKIAVIIDKIARVMTINADEVRPPPQMLSGIGTEYIHGVIHQESLYLVVLDTHRLFNSKELQKIISV